MRFTKKIYMKKIMKHSIDSPKLLVNFIFFQLTSELPSNSLNRLYFKGMTSESAELLPIQ